VSARCRWLALAAAFILAACVSQETKRDAINDINAAFKADYEAGLARDGTRTFKQPTGPTFDAVNAALTRLGLVIEKRSPELGFIAAEAPAPLPLDRSEWDRAAAADLPRARAILARHIGALAEWFNFEPEGLDTIITATVIEATGGSEVSFTMRMREIAPPKQDLPRREYPPPTAAKIGLDKIWKTVDAELAARATKR
jgi:hypothetical protein